MKSRVGQRQREDQRREWVRRKKMQMREKVGKSRNTVFFQWFVAPEGRKVGSLKRLVRSQLARWEMKNCTPLWREAHFQVKMYKTHHSQTTFGSWDVEKCTPLRREAHFEVKMYKTHHCRTTFGSWDVEKVHASVARSTYHIGTFIFNPDDHDIEDAPETQLENPEMVVEFWLEEDYAISTGFQKDQAALTTFRNANANSFSHHSPQQNFLKLITY